jgi:hypothetical protein
MQTNTAVQCADHVAHNQSIAQELMDVKIVDAEE